MLMSLVISDHFGLLNILVIKLMDSQFASPKNMENKGLLMMNHLFSPFEFKGLELKNRLVMPPMCQYSVEKKDGVANDWHYLHYVNRAIGGAGFIIIEMTDVEPDGRITDFDLRLWSDEQIPVLARIVEACHKYGAKVGIQIAHAGRKAEDAAVQVT